MNYDVVLLRRACQDLALENIILKSRLDDVESRLSHVCSIAFEAAERVNEHLQKGGEADENPIGSDRRSHT